MSDDLTTLARALIDGGRFATLGTADEGGRPWVSPVWYAPDGPRDLLWVSTPDRRHSRNVAVRPETGLVIFDTAAAVGAVQAFYATARAEQLTGDERDRAVQVFSARGGAGPTAVAVRRRPGARPSSALPRDHRRGVRARRG
jgi:uncharacterized protein YhbP (UPF0306 family)